MSLTSSGLLQEPPAPSLSEVVAVDAKAANGLLLLDDEGIPPLRKRFPDGMQTRVKARRQKEDVFEGTKDGSGRVL